MPINYANQFIRSIRINSNLTQEDFCDNICSVQALSDIENGKQGLSPVTFEKLCERGGVPAKKYPCFANWADFYCFFSLHRTELYLYSWEFNSAYEELQNIEKNNFANNKFIYQRWLLLHALLQDFTKNASTSQQYSLLMHAINIDLNYPSPLQKAADSISFTDISLLILLAKNQFLSGNYNLAYALSKDLLVILDYRNFTDQNCFFYKSLLQIIQCHFFIKLSRYEDAHSLASIIFEEAKKRRLTIIMVKALYIKGIARYYSSHNEEALELFKQIHATLFLLDSNYASLFLYELSSSLHISPDTIFHYDGSLSPIKKYSYPSYHHYEHMGCGVFNIHDTSYISFGKIIRTLKEKQHLKSSDIYNGLCSKSQFSKIENDIQRPNALLAEALLQRLGIYERIFDFYGTKEECKFQDISNRLSFLTAKDVEEAKSLLQELKKLKLHTKLLEQFILFNEAIYCDSPKIRLSTLTKALGISTTDFNSNTFSWNEFYIYVHILRLKLKEDVTIWDSKLCLLINSISRSNLDLTQKRLLLPILFLSLPNKAFGMKGLTHFYSIKKELSSPLLKYYIGITASIKLYIYYYITMFYPYIFSPSDFQEIQLCLFVSKMSLSTSVYEEFEDYFKKRFPLC